MSMIRAIASVLPRMRLTQQELAERFGEKEMKSVAKMTGIYERRLAAPTQCASDLGAEAAERLFAHHAIDRSSIDAIIFTSQTPDYLAPATACVLHGRLGLSENCASFDINQACSGFIYSLGVGHGLIASGIRKRILLINADTLSKVIDPNDRGLMALNGDGATAALLEPAPQGYGIEAVKFGSDGTQYDKLLIPASGCRAMASADLPEKKLRMDGPAVFHFAVYRVSDFLRNCLAEWQMSMDDIDLVLLHQANKTMIDMIYRSVGVPAEKQFTNIAEFGNLAGAALPTVLAHAWREGKIRPGSRSLLCGFGGGLSWGALTIRWPENFDAATPGPLDSTFTEVT